MVTKTDHSLDHFKLEDTRITRRYFGKFKRIAQYMSRVAATMEGAGSFLTVPDDRGEV